MGLKLDWEIEAEQSQVRNTGEDAESRKRRRKARNRVVLLIVFVLLVFGALGAGLFLRLRYVEQMVEQNLRDTVEAEVTALRIADRAAYLGLQRSASEDWLLAQEQTFNAYQVLKSEQDVQLTGNILDVVVDNNRARVRVEEIIDGVPYSRIWFYWLYEEGWRHVPPDFTFWGDVQTFAADGVSVRARSVDAAVASAMRHQLASWIAQGCDIFGCATLPTISVEIVPSAELTPAWSSANPWVMQVASPSVVRARLDMPFDASLQVPVALLLAERLVAQAMDNEQPVYPADAVYLRSAVVAWLADRFVDIQSDSYLVQSLAAQFGEAAVGRLISALAPDADIQILAAVTGAVSLDATGLDWRDFLAWRLNLERELISQRNEHALLSLYDVGDDSARNLALTRYNAVPSSEALAVVAVSPELDANGVAHLRARVQYGGAGEATVREEEVIFRLVAGSWKRAN